MKQPWVFGLDGNKPPYTSSVDGQIAVPLFSEAKAADGRELRLRIDPADAIDVGTALIYQGMRALTGQEKAGQASTATSVRRPRRRT